VEAGLFGTTSNQLSLIFVATISSLLAFLAIVTKPTPVSVILFGGLTYISFGNGTGGYVFFMALFPILYFVLKKGLYKSRKQRLYTLFFCMILLLLDTLYMWMQYRELYSDICFMIISVFIALVYATHKPKFIQRWFPVAEELHEANKIALSTRILLFFGVIAFIVFLADLYSFDRSQTQKGIDQDSHFEKRIEKDAATLLEDNDFSDQTAQKLLDLIGSFYEGVICYDVKNEKYIEAYQGDAPESLNKTVFETQIRSVLKEDGYADLNNQITSGFYYSLSNFNLYDENQRDLQYVVFMVQYEGRIATGNVIGIRSSFSRFFVMICMLLPIFFWLIEFMLTKPINSMTALVSKYVYSGVDQRNELEKQFTELNIHTGDEIENLYHAFSKTILDMNAYIDDLHMKNEQITRMQFSMISTLASVVENRDKNTGSHIKRTAEYVEIIGTQLSKSEKYKDVLTKKYIEDMKIAAPLHDMGKIQVSDTILNKQGKLNDEEYAAMKKHSAEGKRILQETIKEFGEFDYLLMAVEMAGSHHERYDGKGYPEGLAGDEIPLCARIMAVADVYDALVSKRSYKPAMPLSQAYSIIEEGKGTQFDADVVDAFFAAKEQIEELYHSFE